MGVRLTMMHETVFKVIYWFFHVRIFFYIWTGIVKKKRGNTKFPVLSKQYLKNEVWTISKLRVQGDEMITNWKRTDVLKLYRRLKAFSCSTGKKLVFVIALKLNHYYCTVCKLTTIVKNTVNISYICLYICKS